MGADPSRSRSDQRALMARAGAALFIGEGLLALIASATSTSAGWRALVVAGVALAAVGLAAITYLCHRRLRRWHTHAICAAGAVLIGVVVAVERPIYSVLYVWLALFVAALLRPRAVAAHVAWILACDAVAVTISDQVGRPIESWLLLTGILVGASAFVSFVRGYLTQLAEREREARTVLDTLFRQAPVGLALFDRELRYVRVNDTLASWTGIPAQDYAGRGIDDITPGVGWQVEPAMRRVLESGEPEADVHARRDGRIYRSSRYPITDERGQVSLIASIIDDVTELEEARERLDEQNRALAEAAATDPVTGALNRRAFEHALGTALEAADDETVIAVLYLDLDGFKKINDDHGHDAGDRVLAEVAGRLRSVARADDTVARIGGDEFALILPQLPAASPAVVLAGLAGRIHDVLAPPVSIGRRAARLSTSIGVALHPRDGVAAAVLLKAADAAMYDAKRRGPGRTTLAPSTPLEPGTRLRSIG